MPPVVERFRARVVYPKVSDWRIGITDVLESAQTIGYPLAINKAFIDGLLGEVAIVVGNPTNAVTTRSTSKKCYNLCHRKTSYLMELFINLLLNSERGFNLILE